VKILLEIFLYYSYGVDSYNQYINQQMHLKNTVQDKYHTPTCFYTEVPSSGTLLEQRNTYPTC